MVEIIYEMFRSFFILRSAESLTLLTAKKAQWSFPRCVVFENTSINFNEVQSRTSRSYSGNLKVYNKNHLTNWLRDCSLTTYCNKKKDLYNALGSIHSTETNKAEQIVQLK